MSVEVCQSKVMLRQRFLVTGSLIFFMGRFCYFSMTASRPTWTGRLPADNHSAASKKRADRLENTLDGSRMSLWAHRTPQTGTCA
jgi:hypothetical protein